MIRNLTILVLSFCFIIPGQSQNRSDYFKTVPAIESATPPWAKLMYADDPNVREVDFEYEAYFRTHAFAKSIHTQNYKHWRQIVEPWLNDSGYIRRPTPKDFLNTFTQQAPTNDHKLLPWIPIGPFETYTESSEGNFPVSWQVNVYCMDQSVSNPDILFAGTEAGGLFKTTDHGLNWSLVSSESSILTVQDVKVAPSDPEVVYCASNDIVYSSQNGGLSWTEVFLLGDGIYQLEIDPQNPAVVFCATQSGLYRSQNAGTDWEQLTNGTCWDVKYQAGNNQVLFLLRTNTSAKRCEFLKSIDGGSSWQLKDAGWYVPTDLSAASDIGARIAVTPADPQRVYVALLGQSKADDNGWIGVYTSYNAGESWANLNLPDGGPYNNDSHQNLATINKDGTGFHQGFYNFGIAASHQNADRLFVGCLSLNISQDAGASFLRIGGYSAGNNDIGWVHPDVQDLHVLGNDIWICTDGGLNYSNDELQSHQSRKSGIYGSDFWGFGQGWNQDVLVGGRYHNGNGGYYQTYGIGNFLRLGGAEASTGYVNPLHERTAYFSDISTKVLPETLDGPVPQLGSLGLYPNEAYTVSYSSELVVDPRYADHFYMGQDNKIWKSTNEGGFFEALYTFPEEGRVLEIEICRADPNRMYCVFHPGTYYWDPCKIYGSTNGGISWGELPGLPTNNTFRLEISVNPQNPDELWAVSVDADPNTKVFQTLNGGALWIDRSAPEIAAGSIRDVQFQAGTESLVYLSTSRGVFYWDSGSESWVDYSGGLPELTRALEMIPFYRDSKLRLSTNGRGIWEAPMAAPFEPIAQPMTETDRIYCSRDTVQFDCYSVLDHVNASWSWTITPAPDYVNALDIRNPRVVFGAEGSYEVSLTVTDGNGNSSTQSIPDMVTVENLCVLDTVPGFTMKTTQSGDYATTSNFNLTTNYFTLTAWVKPEGIQQDYTGIGMNNGTAGGLNFKSNNELGYHWPGGAWWWDSGLTAPSGEWSYVALVITPDSATVYVNGQASTHIESMDPIDLTTLNLGSYQGWGSRNFTGEMDEVCLWSRALSQAEIREMRHLTKTETQIADPDLLAYYQFNEPEGDILDRAGIAHATLRGGASRMVSSVPVAGGAFFRGQITSTDLTTFGNTGLAIDYLSNSSYPTGELVVSRLHWTPFNTPNANPGAETYWIINHYGTGNFWGLESIRFALPYGEWNPDLADNPEMGVLYARGANSETTPWTQNCLGSELSDALIFGTACNVPEFGQLYIVSADMGFPILEDGTASAALELPKERVKVYPNPASSELWIENPNASTLRFKMYDATGKLQLDRFCEWPSTNVLLEDFPAGIYFYQVEGTDFIQTGKLIVN
ncbi:MAG: T9SS type A sorting domain-containing protein [Saprospiraceae bacterium]|nr:T9SS type A sorting domain-containing protein [Saprospiraceae bacterium]